MLFTPAHQEKLFSKGKSRWIIWKVRSPETNKAMKHRSVYTIPWQLFLILIFQFWSCSNAEAFSWFWGSICEIPILSEILIFRHMGLCPHHSSIQIQLKIEDACVTTVCVCSTKQVFCVITCDKEYKYTAWIILVGF